ncbi:hypothetical protein KAS14_03790 [Candidatus Bathyarchaeota archaeon]|nr:hypothetical protein [Candidatus Bathyarchaeota archaeon]
MRVEIEVPDGISKFLESIEINMQKYAEESVQHAFRADFDVLRNDQKRLMDLDVLIKKYDLKNFVWTYK